MTPFNDIPAVPNVIVRVPGAPFGAKSIGPSSVPAPLNAASATNAIGFRNAVLNATVPPFTTNVAAPIAYGEFTFNVVPRFAKTRDAALKSFRFCNVTAPRFPLM
jgi:hypothetical protein